MADIGPILAKLRPTSARSRPRVARAATHCGQCLCRTAWRSIATELCPVFCLRRCGASSSASLNCNRRGVLPMFCPNRPKLATAVRKLLQECSRAYFWFICLAISQRIFGGPCYEENMASMFARDAPRAVEDFVSNASACFRGPRLDGMHMLSAARSKSQQMWLNWANVAQYRAEYGVVPELVNTRPTWNYVSVDRIRRSRLVPLEPLFAAVPSRPLATLNIGFLGRRGSGAAKCCPDPRRERRLRHGLPKHPRSRLRTAYRPCAQRPRRGCSC